MKHKEHYYDIIIISEKWYILVLQQVHRDFLPYVCVCVCVCVCVFIQLHITAQSGPVILVILRHSH